MAYIGKTNWTNNEIVEAVDMNRIEQGISDADIGLGSVQTEVTAHKADGTQHAKTARFVVGTLIAGWTAADCDYLCDGTADQAEINAAITALPATGGEIVILDGTYNITAKIDVTKDNVSIRGNGNATILKRVFDSTFAEGVITLTGRSGCQIANLRVDGNKVSYTGFNNFGIYLDSSSDNTITGNTCNSNIVTGIYLGNSSSNNIVTGNICNNSDNSGISLDSSSNNTITCNTCSSNNSEGINLSFSSNNIVTGNTCNNGDNFGIYLGNSSDNTVTGNTCNNNVSGIYLDSSSDNAITGNTCNNNNDNGIYLESSSDNAATGNTCNNNITGIYLGSSSNNNIVTGNTCNSNSYSGIYMSNSSNNAITGNVCNHNSEGINLSSSGNNTVTGNTCIRGTGLSADYTANQYTIRLRATGSDYNLIAMNNCMGKAVTSEGGTGNTLVNNKFDAT